MAAETVCSLGPRLAREGNSNPTGDGHRHRASRRDLGGARALPAVSPAPWRAERGVGGSVGRYTGDGHARRHVLPGEPTHPLEVRAWPRISPLYLVRHPRCISVALIPLHRFSAPRPPLNPSSAGANRTLRCAAVDGAVGLVRGEDIFVRCVLVPFLSRLAQPRPSFYVSVTQTVIQTVTRGLSVAGTRGINQRARW